MKSLNNLKLGYFLVLITVTILWRWLPHPAGMSPILPLALFLGATAPAMASVVMVLVCQAIADAWIGVDITWPAVYFSLLLSILVGNMTQSLTMRSRSWWVSVPGLSILNSLMFFVITNAAVWALTLMYPRTVDGLWLSYVAGLPFLKNGLACDLLLSMVFFSIWHFVIVGKTQTSSVKI